MTLSLPLNLFGVFAYTNQIAFTFFICGHFVFPCYFYYPHQFHTIESKWAKKKKTTIDKIAMIVKTKAILILSVIPI